MCGRAKESGGGIDKLDGRISVGEGHVLRSWVKQAVSGEYGRKGHYCTVICVCINVSIGELILDRSHYIQEVCTSAHDAQPV
jgi:hypothetical protein